MSRHGSTKERILDMVSNGDETLTSISKKLGLAPSTVSKHLKELRADGAISQRRNDHVKKWKYYGLAKNDGEKEGGFHINRNTAITISSIVVAAVIIALAILAHTNNINQSVLGVSVPISLTDPPEVPYGTSALYINYSSIMIQVNKSGSIQNIFLNTSGRIDLMGLVNESQVIGTITAQTNARLYGVTFNIDSASITIENVTYQVKAHSSYISADVVNYGRLNSTSGILLDFFPVVIPVYGKNSTTFEMLATMRAAVVPSRQSIGNGNGDMVYARYPLPPKVLGMFPILDNNLSITNISTTVTGDVLSLSIGVFNNAANGITVYGAMLENKNLSLYQPYPQGADSDAIISAGNAGVGGNLVWGQNEVIYNDSNYGNGETVNVFFNQTNNTLAINSSRLLSIGRYAGGRMFVIRLPRPISNITISGIGMPDQGMQIMNYQSPIAFTANANGALSLLNQMQGNVSMPVAGDLVNDAQTQGINPEKTVVLGYVVQGGADGVLTYNGPYPTDVYENGVNLSKGNYTITLITSGGVVQK